MVITIITDDKVLGVDGAFIGEIDYSDLDQTIHSIQWDSSEGRGDVEYRSITCPACKCVSKKPNAAISDFSPYQKYVDQWQALVDAAKKAEADAEAARVSGPAMGAMNVIAD